MNLKKMLENDSAVSISVGFILMFAISVIVFTALIISFYNLTQSSEKTAMRESFGILGEALTNKITTVDTLVNITFSNSGIINSLDYEFSMPESIASKSYTINITNSSKQIIFESDNGARSVAPFNTSVNFIGRKIYSGAGNYKFIFDKATQSIYVEDE